MTALLRPTHPRFLSPAWPLAVDLKRFHKIAATVGHFLAHPIKIRQQGPTAHWKTRARKIAEGTA